MHDIGDSNDEQMKDLLARARRGLSPSAGDAERVRRGLGAAVARGAAAPATPAQGWGTHPWIGRVMMTAAFTAAGAAGGYWVGRQAPPAAGQAPPAVAAAASTTAPPAALLADPAVERARPAPPAGMSGGRRAESVRRRTSDGPAKTAAESLALEVRALRNVERALRDRNPGLARAYLDDLEREVPGGQMREERVALRAIARCASGSQPFGVDPAHDFAAAYPASAYRARVEQACGGTDSAGAGD